MFIEIILFLLYFYHKDRYNKIVKENELRREMKLPLIPEVKIHNRVIWLGLFWVAIELIVVLLFW